MYNQHIEQNAIGDLVQSAEKWLTWMLVEVLGHTGTSIS